jgi:xanthine/uracil/vitamin C permease (AzgA family)
VSFLPKRLSQTLKFDRNEISGAFGDIGTDFPLMVSMILVCGLDPASVLIMFGAMQMLTGLLYGLPMPVQPLKAMAVIVITQRLSGNILYGGGLAIGITMLILTATGLLTWIAAVVPKCVIRGIQFGLGIQLASLALKDYVGAEGLAGYGLAATGFVLTLAFIGNRRFPPAPFVIALGLLYALTLKLDAGVFWHSAALSLPRFHAPTLQDVETGFVTLALPQLALSIGNSILATRQVIQDFFPHRSISIKKIGLTYSLMNLIKPFFGGIPVCHGSGGVAGHYTFGARTGGSVIVYGSLYLLLGLFFSSGFREVIQIFPRPILGVILMFEGLALMRLLRDVIDPKVDFTIALMVGLMAVGLPYGYLIGLLIGVPLARLAKTQFTALAD